MDIDLLNLLDKATNPYKRASLYIILFFVFLSVSYAASAAVYRGFTTFDYRERTHIRLINSMDNLRNLTSTRLYFLILFQLSLFLDFVYGQPADNRGRFKSFFTVRAFQTSAIVTCLYLAIADGVYSTSYILTVDDLILTSVYFIAAWCLYKLFRARRFTSNNLVRGCVCFLVTSLLWLTASLVLGFDNTFNLTILDDQSVDLGTIIIPLCLIERIFCGVGSDVHGPSCFDRVKILTIVASVPDRSTSTGRDRASWCTR
jgi:hypothetical protein